MAIQYRNKYRRKLTTSATALIVLTLSFYVVLETDIVDVRKQAKKFETAVNWYRSVSSSNSTLVRNGSSWSNLMLNVTGKQKESPVTLTSATARQNDTVLFPDRVGKPLKIVFWTKLFEQTWGFQSGFDEQMNSCPDLKKICVFTYNRSQGHDADVLLFHMRNSFQFPSHRPPFQKWVFAIRESPINTHVNLDTMRWLFNLTMTYKRSSDITWEIGHCTRMSEAERTRAIDPERNIAAGKKHLAAWFVSNCGGQSKRQGYVRELMKYIGLHKYGCGGNYSCPKAQKKRCSEMLNTTYKFYMSFENSLCEDYLTEKVYGILKINVVPVVLGYSNYSDILPPHSFIDVRDYESPKTLAGYLNMLSNNDKLYNEYFRWKEAYTCEGIRPPVACRLCETALRKRQHIQTVDIKQFWSKETNCISPKQYYNSVNLQ